MRKRREYKPSLKRLEAILADWKRERETGKLGLRHLADSAIAHFEAEIAKRKPKEQAA